MHNTLLAAMLGTTIVCTTPAIAQTPTTFTYQGHLVDNDTPADGLYEFEVRLLDNLSIQIGLTQTPLATVTEGVFTMDLDFGPATFDGNQRFIEISVRSVAGGGAYTTLTPNHPITSTPIAQFALEGNEGPAGPQGPDGQQGNQGVQGNPGPAGPQGNPGTNGNDGSTGPEGPQGPQGDTGPAGTTLWSGLTGVPAGFADGIDNDTNTTYGAGAGLELLNSTFFIPSNSITSGFLASNSVNNNEISDNAVGASEIATDAVGSSEIAANAVGSSELANNENSLFKVSGSVMDSSGGALIISGTTVANKVRLNGGTDANLAGGGFLSIGSTTSTNLVMDNNEIMARSNGSAANLSLNIDGGNIILGDSISDGFIGIGTNTPLARMHINADSAQSPFRAQLDGTTRLLVNANGGVSIGANDNLVAAGNAYVSGSLGVGDSTPNAKLHVVAGNTTNDGVFVTSGSRETMFSPSVFSANNDYTFESIADIHIDSLVETRIDGGVNVQLNAGNTVDINGATFVDIDGGVNVQIEGTTFTGNDVTIADDLSVNNDIIATSQFTVGGAKAFTFDINCWGDAGKAGGGLWAVFSDERLKQNIQPMTGSLETLSQLRPVNFEYKEQDHFSYLPGTQRGFIAQDVQRVIPEWVETADDGYLYLNQTGYEALIVDAIQELRSEKDSQIKQLQTENQILQSRLDRLEQIVLRLGASNEF